MIPCMADRLTTDELKGMRNDLRLTQKEMAELLGVDRGLYNNFEARAVPLKYVDQVRETFHRELERRKADLQKRTSETSGQKQTHVYYNESQTNEDSARARRLDLGRAILQRETVRVDALRVSPSSAWSAKRIEHVSRTISALLGVASDYIVVDDDNLTNLRPGTMLVFQPTEYPLEDVYLLFRSKKEPDLFAIGDIDANEPTTVQIGKTKESLSDWTVVGWAFAAAWGLGENLEDYRVASKGIGRRTRVH